MRRLFDCSSQLAVSRGATRVFRRHKVTPKYDLSDDFSVYQLLFCFLMVMGLIVLFLELALS